MPFFGSGARSTQDHSHGRLPPVSLAGAHLGERALAQTLDVPLYLLLAATERDGVGLRDHHRVGPAALFEPHPEGVRATVEGVRDHPPGGDPGPERPIQHLLGQLDLVAEDDPLGDAGFSSSVGGVRPAPGQVERPVDEGCSLLRGVGKERADLAVDRVSGGAGVLAGDANALLALLQKAGLVHDEDARLFVAEVLDHVLP
jgi:hypothetical protein